MFVSLNWLRDFVEIPANVDAEELGKLLTIRSAEVEGVFDQKKAFEGIVVGELLEFKKHPDADKLHIAKVNIGQDEPLQLIFGQMVEMHPGDRVPVAVAPCVLPSGIEINKKKLRGVETGGMLCLDQELGLRDDDGVNLSYFPNLEPGTPLSEAMGLDDVIIEFDNKALTHRPDLWGHIGMAREIGAVMDMPFKAELPPIDPPASGEKMDIDVQDTDLCPRYMGLIIRGVKVAQSPDWLKKRLLATGHSTYSNIVDVTNYVLEELGQPMHAFDLRMIEGGIVVRTAKDGEKITTLDGEEKTLEKNMLVIADHKKPVAVAGVMGGEHSGIQADTVDILLESANFDAASVRRTSTKLGLRTDSVQRFEKSLDPVQCKHAILRAAQLILELCPDAQLGALVDIANFEEGEPIITVDVARIQKKIGVDVPATDMANFLKRLHFGIQDKVSDSTQQLTMSIPSYRATKDVEIEDDIVEEVARMYGYENIPATVPHLPAKAPTFNIQRRHKHDTREIFANALGYTESYNYSFYSEKTIADYGLEKASHLHLKNYLSEDQSHLRTTLIPNLIRSLRTAMKFEQDPALFELGRTYEEIGEFMPLEKKALCAARLFNKKERNPFTHVKGDLEQFLKKFGIEKVIFETAEQPALYMHPHQVASVKINGQAMGVIFTLHPSIAEKEDFEGRIACFELDFEALSSARRQTKTYKAQSNFPAIEFDVSVELDRKISAAEIEKTISRAVGKNLTALELFDTYEGDKIEAGKKSLAYRITLQAEDKTLTNEDLVQAQKATWAALEKLGGKIRGLS